MRLYEPKFSTLLDCRPGRVSERGGDILGEILFRSGALELTRQELIDLLSAGRDVLQRVDAAYDRRARGQRPIPAHGQPARPFIEVPPTPAELMPTTLAMPGSHLTPVPRHAAPPSPPPPAGPVPAARQEGQVVPDPPPAAAS
ncbi:hypothetical protein HD597_010052 [Nonomuraea thailandensis]|uniref:Uncharacterized protein n=1 Tax=Nonomuraea thailandensis TaxID=1188745 RepID=A0A9X2GSN8_9ACTN|nr:hypothetical protein [Nonomuraea thailandensis]MCP2363032.1 hypothetical protein [Nonomuraea thailandensis]